MFMISVFLVWVVFGHFGGSFFSHPPPPPQNKKKVAPSACMTSACVPTMEVFLTISGKRMSPRWLVTAFPTKGATDETYKQVFAVIAWSFNMLWLGKHPTHRPTTHSNNPHNQLSKPLPQEVWSQGSRQKSLGKENRPPDGQPPCPKEKTFFAATSCPRKRAAWLKHPSLCLFFWGWLIGLKLCV